MEFMDCVCARRSVRKYNGQSVSAEALNQIMTAGLMAPTGKNTQEVDLIGVTGAQAMAELAKVKAAGALMLKTADCAVVVAGDEARSDTWVEDCSAAISYMMLRATDLGIASCWCQCHLRQSAEVDENGPMSAEGYVKKLLGLPESYRVLAILSLGYPEEAPVPHTPAEVNPARLHMGKF